MATAISARALARGLGPLADDAKKIRVIVETPKGRRNKFAFDPDSGHFVLKKVLPAGSAFPYDFGFIPDTKAADGDPLDVLLLMDESAFPGCVVIARLIGVLEAEQTEDKQTIRNDRLIAVAEPAHDYADLHTLKDINPNLLKELEAFFVNYNKVEGRRFKLLEARGPKRAWTLLRKASRTKKRK